MRKMDQINNFLLHTMKALFFLLLLILKKTFFFVFDISFFFREFFGDFYFYNFLAINTHLSHERSSNSASSSTLKARGDLTEKNSDIFRSYLESLHNIRPYHLSASNWLSSPDICTIVWTTMRCEKSDNDSFALWLLTDWGLKLQFSPLWTIIMSTTALAINMYWTDAIANWSLTFPNRTDKKTFHNFFFSP